MSKRHGADTSNPALDVNSDHGVSRSTSRPSRCTSISTSSPSGGTEVPKTIQLRTAVPGPKSQALMQRRNQAVARGVFHATPIFAARAQGATVEDVDGNIFLDFSGGIGCNNVGHRNPSVVERMKAQVDRYIHTCFSVAPYAPYA